VGGSNVAKNIALQRKAVDLLVSSGEQPIRAEDITWIQAVMEEAAHLREMQQQAQDMTAPQK
jgi:hypothetical protein